MVLLQQALPDPQRGVVKNSFGVQFQVHDRQRFQSLRLLYAELKRDRDRREFRDATEWVRAVPDEIKAQFEWPSPEERDQWLAARDSTVIAIPSPSQQLGAKWDFYRVFEAIEESEYDLLGCKMVGEDIAEMKSTHIRIRMVASDQ